MSSTLNELLNSGVSTNQQDMELKMQQQQQQKMNRCSRGSESNEDDDNDEIDSGGGDDCDLGSSNGNSRRTSSVMPNSASCNKLSSNNHHHHLNESSGLGSSLLSPAPSSQYDHHHSPTYSDFMSSATSNGRVIRDMSNESLNEHDLGGEHEQQTSQPFDTMASINSLLLAMAATTNGGQQQQSNGAGPTSPNEFINSPQLKRPNASGSGFLGNLSSAAAAANMLFSTPIAPSSNSGNNGTSPSASGTNLASTNRLNSTPSFNTNANSMLMNLDQQSSQNRFYGRPLNAGSSMSASSSAYNLSSSTSHHNHHHHHQNQQQQQQQHHENANNSSIYDDDEVFSSFSASQQQQQQQSNNNQQQSGANNTSQQQQQEAMIAHLFRSLMMNRSQSQSQQSNNNTGNISELLMNQSLANMSLNSAANEPLNTNASANFLNMSAASNTSPTLNASNQAASNIAALLNQFKALTGSNGASATNAPNQANLAGLSPLAAAAALLKQQQKQSMNLRGGTSSLQSSPMQSSNIAALISATSNMASLLNSASTQQQPQQQQQHQQQQQQQQFDVKRRINSVATSSGFSGNASPQSSLLTHNAGPNAAVLLQNSSLASSARLNMSASSSMTASVLGSNSPLTQTLNAALQQQSQQSPNASSSHNLLSALSLSSSAGANSKPLRSERLPPHMVDEIIKQGKIRRKQGGKKEVCVFCRNNSEKEQFYTSHTLKDAQNNVACPILRLYQCPICHASGDQAHTIKYCPYAEKDSAYIKLFKDTNKMSAAASYLINSLTSAAGNGGSGSQGPNGPSANVSLNGAATPPSSAVSPPDTPSPISSQPPASFGQGPHGLNFLNSPQISSPSTASAHMSLVQALTNFQQQQQQGNANAASLNRSFGGMPSSSLLAAASFLNSTNSNLNKSN